MPNRLAGETSPYLLQHADNPVDWHPWGEAALDLARREQKPILLSIGYSACHWCHVMAHESFEDPAVAAAMNADFVNVKVDREERPDLDQIYQTAHALLTRRSGGWPLTMFLTPDGTPFFGGTYFPREGRYGLPGFLDLLPRVAAAYRAQGAAIAEHGARLRGALASLEPDPGAAGGLPGRAPALALEALKATFDPVHGGFGGAPKFPHPTDLELCLRAAVRQHDADALAVVRVTLERMADGGIHDQLAGGFCRYSVDAEWSIPHFEKMLYDNGPLLGLYADVARVTGEPRFAEVARGIAGWMTREMRAPDGAFWSSLDADSEGEEGRFYVWSRDEVRGLLSAEDYAVAAAHFGLDGPPNFEGHAWHLRVAMPLDAVASRLGLDAATAGARLARAKAALLAARAQRVRPGLDDKILTSWNALAIAGLARAARALDEPAFADLAAAAAGALRATAWRGGRLLATRKGARAHLNAYLDDHAFLLAALIELMQARFRREDFEWACELAELLLAQFEDRAHGGFFFTSHDHEALFHRTKPGPDNATPSGNGVAASALIALGHLAAEPRYVDAGERAVRAFGAALAESPRGCASLLAALEDALSPPSSVLLAGDAPTCLEWQRALEGKLRPGVRTFDLAGRDVPAAMARGAPPDSGAVAWVCRGTQCHPPARSLAEIEALLVV
ncbi:MAG TPA: thioredoxin domain-containing protein [Casimicrobiaceae bacterium]|nr:thioredoxin domain-containing protein [Casimicrobiaceae bacterium]